MSIMLRAASLVSLYSGVDRLFAERFTSEYLRPSFDFKGILFVGVFTDKCSQHFQFHNPPSLRNDVVVRGSNEFPTL